MKGMELARAYYEAYGKELIETQFSQYRDKIAAGLVGEGSECFGYDDSYSQDHDFGPGFCIWIPQTVYQKIGASMQQAYEALPKTYQGFTRMETPQGGGRVGVLPLEGFYQKYTGLTDAPRDNMEWFRIPERFLATAVNGQVFCDHFGEFSRIRTALQGFYPEDVLKKKLAARTVIMAQAGQYNYPRCSKRGDSQAAYFACGEFVKAALSAVYLLNHVYMPYYKWAFRRTEELTMLRSTVQELKYLTVISDTPENSGRKEQLIEKICGDIAAELNRRGMTRTTDSFLQTHGQELMQGIRDSRLAGLHIMVDCD